MNGQPSDSRFSLLSPMKTEEPARYFSGSSTETVQKCVPLKAKILCFQWPGEQRTPNSEQRSSTHASSEKALPAPPSLPFSPSPLLPLSHSPTHPLSRHTYHHPQMGTLFKIILYAEDSLAAHAAARAAFTRIDSLNAILSDYREDSELSRLSARAGDGQWAPVSDELWFLLQKSQEMAALSDGAFDATIGPLSKLWRKAFRQGEFPDTSALLAAKARVGYPHLQFHKTQQMVRLALPAMRLDLGGIAKGFAVDEAMKVLRQHGISIALVDGGGDLLAAEP
ncbi:MAG: FAD:protein FMN transferase, partial [Phaeodactylibacter sp.]|nr:FAD:protein FMN transferase [Phaeodactylibacter sp.]